MTVISVFIIFFKWQASPRRNDTSWSIEKKLLSQKGGVRHTQRVFMVVQTLDTMLPGRSVGRIHPTVKAQCKNESELSGG